MKTDKSAEITALIDKAAKAHHSCDALRFSQAACNAANAMCSLHTARGMDPDRDAISGMTEQQA